MVGETCIVWVPADAAVPSDGLPDGGIVYAYCGLTVEGREEAVACSDPPWLDASLPYDEQPIKLGGPYAPTDPYYAICGCQ